MSEAPLYERSPTEVVCVLQDKAEEENRNFKAEFDNVQKEIEQVSNHTHLPTRFSSEFGPYKTVEARLWPWFRVQGTGVPPESLRPNPLTGPRESLS